MNRQSLLIGMVLLVVLLLSGCVPAAESPPTPTPQVRLPTAAAQASPAVQPTIPPISTTTPIPGEMPPGTTPIPEATPFLPAPGEVITNPAGFTFEPPEGWQITFNEGAPVVGGFSAMIPPGDNPDDPASIIVINVGDPVFFLPGNISLDRETTVQEAMNALIADSAAGGAVLTNTVTIEVDGEPAMAAEVRDNVSDGRIVLARRTPENWLMLLALTPPGEWNQAAFDTVLNSLLFFEAEDEAIDVEVLPTGVPTDTLDMTTSPTSTDSLTDTGRVFNDAGFSFVPPEGWELALNMGSLGAEGMASLFPAGAEADNPDSTIVLNAGATLFLMPGDLELEQGASADTLLDALAASDDPAISLAGRQDIQMGEQTGRAANITIADPEEGDARGRVAITRLGEQRWFMLLGVAPAGKWQQAPFDATLETLQFVHVAPPTTSTAETTIFPLPPSARNVIALNEAGTINFQTSLNVPDLVAFYRDAFTSEGATERADLTVVSDETFSLAFDGWPQAEGKTVLVQGVEIDPLQINISIQLEDM